MESIFMLPFILATVCGLLEWTLIIPFCFIVFLSFCRFLYSSFFPFLYVTFPIHHGNIEGKGPEIFHKKHKLYYFLTWKIGMLSSKFPQNCSLVENWLFIKWEKSKWWCTIFSHWDCNIMLKNSSTKLDKSETKYTQFHRITNM